MGERQERNRVDRRHLEPGDRAARRSVPAAPTATPSGCRSASAGPHSHGHPRTPPRTWSCIPSDSTSRCAGGSRGGSSSTAMSDLCHRARAGRIHPPGVRDRWRMPDRHTYPDPHQAPRADARLVRGTGVRWARSPVAQRVARHLDRERPMGRSGRRAARRRRRPCGSSAPSRSSVRCHPWIWSGIDWLIVGGESGSSHRPMDEAWVRDLKRHAPRGRDGLLLQAVGWPDAESRRKAPRWSNLGRVPDRPACRGCAILGANLITVPGTYVPWRAPAGRLTVSSPSFSATAKVLRLRCLFGRYGVARSV